MNTSGSSAIATHCPSGWLEARRQLGEGRRLVRLEHALGDAGGERLDRAAEQHVDARIVLSAITRASASPDEKRTKLTLMPVAFSNSSNIGRAQFSGQIEYAFNVSAATAGSAAPSAKHDQQETRQGVRADPTCGDNHGISSEAWWPMSVLASADPAKHAPSPRHSRRERRP